jgi:hypothetical protein
MVVAGLVPAAKRLKFFASAPRRLRRWPAAILERGCARRRSAAAGRDEETALQSNQETDQKRLGSLPGHSLPHKQTRAGASTASNPAATTKPEADK